MECIVGDDFDMECGIYLGGGEYSFQMVGFRGDGWRQSKARPVALQGTARPSLGRGAVACIPDIIQKKKCLLVLNLYNFSIEYRFLISFSQLCSIRRDDQNQIPLAYILQTFLFVATYV